MDKTYRVIKAAEEDAIGEGRGQKIAATMLEIARTKIVLASSRQHFAALEATVKQSLSSDKKTVGERAEEIEQKFVKQLNSDTEIGRTNEEIVTLERTLIMLEAALEAQFAIRRDEESGRNIYVQISMEQAKELLSND